MKRDNKTKMNPKKQKGFLKKLASNAGFYFDEIKYKIILLFSKKQTKDADRKFSRRIYDVVPDGNTENQNRRKRKTIQRRTYTETRNNKPNKKKFWFGKTALLFGNIRITRFALLITVLVLVVITSGTFALASANKSNVNKDKSETTIDESELKPIYITYGDITIEIETNAKTVQEVLDENDIKYKENDSMSHRLNQPIYSKIHIKIKQPFTVSIIHQDNIEEIFISEGTVKNALEMSKIEFDEDDRVEPSLDTALTSGIEIVFDKIDIVNIKEETEIEYEVKYGETSTVVSGMYAITQKGKDGTLEKTIAVTYVNGTEESREVIGEKVIKEPINKIVLHGTGTKKASDPDDDEYESIKVTNPGEQATNPSVPSAPSSYIKKVVVHATAYTHTGRTTATGTWPRSTRTLENPGSCAVVPGTFPYGSLIYVKGYGYCIAEDTGGFRHDPDRWNQIDVFMNTYDECRTWGRRREWTAYVLRYGY